MANIFLILLGLTILYLTGWNLMWSGELKFIGDFFSGQSLGTIRFNDVHFNEIKYFIEDKSYFFSSDLFIINFNDLYYGLYNTNRFFNSSILESMGGGAGLMCLFKSLDFTSKELSS